MSELSPEIWAEIERQSVDIVRGQKHISLGALRNILRKSRRTSSQNALLWAIYDQIIKLGGEDMAGWKSEDLHEFFLINHFGSETREIFGRKRLKPLRRSSILSKAEFAELLDSIVRFMAERGVVLSLPGDPMTEDAA